MTHFDAEKQMRKESVDEGRQLYSVLTRHYIKCKLDFCHRCSGVDSILGVIEETHQEYIAERLMEEGN